MSVVWRRPAVKIEVRNRTGSKKVGKNENGAERLHCRRVVVMKQFGWCVGYWRKARGRPVLGARRMEVMVVGVCGRKDVCSQGGSAEEAGVVRDQRVQGHGI